MNHRSKTPLSIWVAYLLLLYIVLGSILVIYMYVQRLSLTLSELVQGPAFWWYLVIGLSSIVAIFSLAIRHRLGRWPTVILLAFVSATSLYTNISNNIKYSLLDVIGGLVVQSIYIVPAIAVIYAMLFSERVKLYFGIPAEDISSYNAPKSRSTAAE